MDEITIINLPPQQVMGITKTGTYGIIPELLMKVYESIVDKKLTITGAPMFICHETCPEAVLEANEKGTAVVEVAWPVSGSSDNSGEIKMYELPGGKMVRAFHKGPYETCESTYYKIFDWIDEQHLQIAGPIREIYPNDPRMVKPEEIVTEIHVPVR